MGWKKSGNLKVHEVKSFCRFFSKAFPPKRPIQNNRIVVTQKKVISVNIVRTTDCTLNELIVCHMNYISTKLLHVNKKKFKRPK